RAFVELHIRHHIRHGCTPHDAEGVEGSLAAAALPIGVRAEAVRAQRAGRVVGSVAARTIFDEQGVVIGCLPEVFGFRCGAWGVDRSGMTHVSDAPESEWRCRDGW